MKTAEFYGFSEYDRKLFGPYDTEEAARQKALDSYGQTDKPILVLKVVNKSTQPPVVKPPRVWANPVAPVEGINK